MLLYHSETRLVFIYFHSILYSPLAGMRVYVGGGAAGERQWVSQSKSLISSSETADGVNTPRSVKSIVMYDGGV